MNRDVSFRVSEDGAGSRLDTLVAEHVEEISRSLARKLIEAGRVSLNGAPAKPSAHPAVGDLVEVQVELPPSLRAEPENIPLHIVYQDGELAVLDKPAGLVVHPGAGHAGGTLANALTALFPSVRSVGPAERPGIVHRLDKDTSGLMVVALSPAVHQSLQRQIASRTAERRYLALATGQVDPPQAIIRGPIGRDPADRKRMALNVPGSRPAETSYRVLERLPGFTLVEASLRTGRTHQIRVHFAGMGHPIAGDRTYHGGAIPGLCRQFLHAHRLSLRAPSTGDLLEFESPLPQDLAAVLARLRGS
ncbi:MAG: RluA family pseudouridine synthase [Chloroflexi bacterium]|nr:RluA family pseudouridine synthase [Chloroflexota bacterium]